MRALRRRSAHLEERAAEARVARRKNQPAHPRRSGGVTTPRALAFPRIARTRREKLPDFAGTREVAPVVARPSGQIVSRNEAVAHNASDVVERLTKIRAAVGKRRDG